MTQQHLLPKFGSGKPADNAVTDPVSLAGPMAQKHATQMTTAEAGNTDFVMAADLEEPLAVPVAPGEAPAAIAQAAVDQTPRPARYRRFVAAFLRQVAGLLRLCRPWSKGPSPFLAKPVARKGPERVQGELLLDSVRVVRNDLSEADLEIVSATKPIEQPREVPEGKSDPEASRLAGRRMASRLFGGKRT